MFKRLKRLWDLTSEKPLPKEWKHFLAKQTNVNPEKDITIDTPPRKMATVMQDDPLDIFPSDNPDEDPNKNIIEY